MKRLAKAAILMKLGQTLKACGSWCGHTHYQKAVYFLQHALGVGLDFSYILYKYGPYSFDLREEMETLEAEGLLSSVSSPPYGPIIKPTELGQQLMESFPKTLAKYDTAILYAARTLGNRQVTELEKLVTSLFIKRNHSEAVTTQDQAELLNQIKPHIPLAEAVQAVQECDRILEDIALTCCER